MVKTKDASKREQLDSGTMPMHDASMPRHPPKKMMKKTKTRKNDNKATIYY